MCNLIRPSPTYKSSYLAAVAEFHREGRHTDKDINQLSRDFPQFVTKLLKQQDGEHLPEGWAPHLEYWLVEGSEFVGRFDIRHSLNAVGLDVNGQIGYTISARVDAAKATASRWCDLVWSRPARKVFDVFSLPVMRIMTLRASLLKASVAGFKTEFQLKVSWTS